MLRLVITFLIWTVSLGGAALSAGEHWHASTEAASHSHDAVGFHCNPIESDGAIPRCCLEDHTDRDDEHRHFLRPLFSTRIQASKFFQHPPLCSLWPKGMLGWRPETRRSPLIRHAAGAAISQQQRSLESIVLLV